MIRSLLNNRRFPANPLTHRPNVALIENVTMLSCSSPQKHRFSHKTAAANGRRYLSTTIRTSNRQNLKPQSHLQNSEEKMRQLKGKETHSSHKKAGKRAAYFRNTSLRIRDIERVLTNQTLAGEILDKIYSGELSEADSKAMQSLVKSAVSWASSAYSEEAYNFLIDAWQIVFLERRQTVELDAIRASLLQYENQLIHAMMNRGDWRTYESLVAPLYERKPASLKSWAMIAMETLQPDAQNSVYKCNIKSIHAFLDSPKTTREQKHRMITMFMTKSLLYGGSAENADTVMNELVYLFRRVEDALLITETPFFHMYRRPLLLLAGARKELTASARVQWMADICEGLVSDREFAHVLTAIACATSELVPYMALSCWQYKTNVINSKRSPHSRRPSTDCRTPQDLKHVMQAYVTLRAYDKALAVYSSHTYLQDDEQITLLLQASERSKDWGLLQKQFEDMYGRGNLPYVVHYAVVMGALASLGSTSEVDQLYEQLLRRNLEPTAPIFLALVRSNINANNPQMASHWYDVFMQAVDAGKIDTKHVPVLQLELLESRLPSMNVVSAIAEFERLSEKQVEQNQAPLLSSDTICSMLHFVSSLYSLQGFEAVWRVAQKWSLVNDQVYSQAITFLTKMGQFQQADDLALEAQLESPIPFQNSLILGCQLRNYRQWRKEITDQETKQLLVEKTKQILAKAEKTDVSPKNLDSFLLEVIKHYTATGKPELARPFLDRANALNISGERHFIPFLKEYSTKGSYDDNSGVLDLYREMVSRKTTITARTYYYLSKSLFMIDAANKNGHGNSFNLLQSVLEMYGFSVLDGNSTNKVSVADLSKNAIHLLKIVSDYAIEASTPSDETMDLVLKFLKQIRAKLDKNIDYGFRVSILTEMSKVYRVYGDLQAANSLVDSALKEMDEIIAQLPPTEPLPKLLQLDYRKTVDIKSQILAQKNNASSSVSEYSELLRHVLTQNVRLSGYQFHNLNHRVLNTSSPVTLESIRLVLESCERHLVSGNWAEVAVNRKVHYIYRMYLVYLGRTMSPGAISARYEILNQFYDVEDVAQVLREFHHIKSPRESIETALREYQAMRPREFWPVETFFEKLAEFFTAERSFESKNFIRPNLASALVTAIEQLCEGDKTLAFKLYDEFPDTLEYLLFYVGERTRVVKFRIGINKLLGQTGLTPVVDREARRQLSIETLQNLWGQ